MATKLDPPRIAKVIETARSETSFRIYPCQLLHAPRVLYRVYICVSSVMQAMMCLLPIQAGVSPRGYLGREETVRWE